MKTRNTRNRNTVLNASVIAAVGLLLCAVAPASISGINTPSTSFATIIFDDTTSIPPTPPPNGAFYSTSTSPWNGSSFTMLTTVDSTTLDEAKGNLLGTCLSGTPTYAVSLNSVTLNQVATNTGVAHLDLRFNIEYQLDGAGLPLQATLFPNFTVNGTVQPGGTGFASFGGTIQYWGMDSSYNPYLLDTVTYAPPNWTTPGPFNGTVSGVPTIGTTPLLPGTVGLSISTLTLIGNFSFMADPATISLETIPEPASLLLLALGGLALIRRRRK